MLRHRRPSSPTSRGGSRPACGFSSLFPPFGVCVPKSLPEIVSPPHPQGFQSKGGDVKPKMNYESEFIGGETGPETGLWADNGQSIKLHCVSRQTDAGSLCAEIPWR